MGKMGKTGGLLRTELQLLQLWLQSQIWPQAVGRIKSPICQKVSLYVCDTYIMNSVH